MKVTWYISADARLPQGILCGHFRIDGRDNFSVVRDALLGYNMLRVDWDETDPPLVKDRIEIMNNMLLAVEVRYNDMKDKHGTTV